MQNLKSQIPNSKKIPKTNYQILPIGASAIGSCDELAKGEAMELHEGTSGNGHPYDLEERTAQFGEAVIRFIKKIPRGPDNDRLISQLVGCGTSVGANYHEANEPMSKKDFRYSIRRCIKEAKETKFFLRMIAASEPRSEGIDSHILQHVSQMNTPYNKTDQTDFFKIGDWDFFGIWDLEFGIWSAD
jgi:four helix bundle protein